MSDHLKFALVLFVVATFALFAMVWESGKRFIACAIAILAVIVVVFFAIRAEAHDHKRPDLDKWYPSLSSRNGPCCDGPGVDAVHLQDPEWKIVVDGSGQHYEVWLDNKWVAVPDSAVLKEPNLDGQAMVWPYKANWGETLIRCFMPGTLG